MVVDKYHLTKTFSFDAAHSLPNYNGPCRNLHGHHWTCKITVSGEYNKETGMVCDFKKLKNIIENNVVSVLDHKNLNDIFENPTAENIAFWIFNALMPDLENIGLFITEVELWESSDSSCIFTRFCEFDLDIHHRVYGNI